MAPCENNSACTSHSRIEWRLLRPLSLAFAGVLLIAAAAGAATGVLSVGSVIGRGEDSGFTHNGASPEQTVLATGSTPVAGAWQLTTYRSEGIVDEQGDTIEAADLPCVRLLLTSPPPKNPINGSAFCLVPGKAAFNASRIPVVDASTGQSEVIVYGFAPKTAAAVELKVAEERTIRSDTQPGGTKFPGTVWAIASPPGPETAQVSWVDRDGIRGGAKLLRP